MKIVFMGTPGFAVPSLKDLINEFGVEAVFTQPDKQRGRGKKVTFSPIKEVALEHDIKIYQPRILRKDEECIEALKELSPDFIVVVAYGQILPKKVLDIPKYGCINLHASLLPKYRGAAPLNWAIIKGEKVSGNTTMHMDVGMDTGDMLISNNVEIDDNMTVSELHDRLSESGGKMLIDTLNGIVSGELKGRPQNDEESCHAPKIDKVLAKINWNETAENIKNLIRGLNQYPGAFSVYQNKNMKIFESEIVDVKSTGNHGAILNVDDTGIVVECGDKGLKITRIQFPGKKPTRVADYLRGNKIEKGIVLE